MKILQWMKICRMGGPSYEDMRVSHLGVALDGKALRWYNEHVDGVHAVRRNWTLLDVFMGLYSHFIHETAIQEATDKFHDARYKTNAEEFYQDLCQLALRMVHPPDKYTFRSRLLLGFPPNIRKKVVERGINAEVSSTEAIVRAARMVEDTTIILNRYEHQSQETHSSSSSSKNQKNMSSSSSSKVQGTSMGQSSKENPTQYQVVNRYTSSAPNTIPSSNRTTTPPVVTRLSPPTQGNHPSGRRSTKRPQEYCGGSTNNSRLLEDIECRICHKKGHYVNQCPDKTSQRMYASRPIVDDSHESSGDKETPSNPTGQEEP